MEVESGTEVKSEVELGAEVKSELELKVREGPGGRVPV